MNGQHLRALPEEELVGRICSTLVDAGVLTSADSAFAKALAGLIKGSVDLLSEAAAQVPPLLGYPLAETVASEEFKPVRALGALGGFGREERNPGGLLLRGQGWCRWTT